MMRVFVIVVLLVGVFHNGNAQTNAPQLTLGYFAPYVIQPGLKAGLAVDLKTWSASQDRVHRLSISPQLGYFTFPNVQHNFLLNAELGYQLLNPVKRFSPLAALGVGYVLGRQRQGGSVNLRTGELAYEVETLHSFLPTVSLGFSLATESAWSYYFKGSFGRKFTAQREASAFIGVELGTAVLLNLQQASK